MQARARRSALFAAIAMLLGCQSAQRDFDKAVAANTDQALADFVGAHAGHPLAAEAKRLLEKRAFERCREQASLRCHEEFLTRFAASPLRAEVEQRLAKLAGEKAYKWRPKRDSAGSSSRDIEVEETSKGLRMTGIGKQAKIASEVVFDQKSFGMRLVYTPDALESTNIKVVVGKQLGYTTLAGLRFRQGAVVNIWKDGTVEVDRAGVPADDEQKRSLVSRKATLDGKTVFVMVES